MRNFLPGVSERTDNATVFEHAVKFITFMRENVGDEYDMVNIVHLYISCTVLFICILVSSRKSKEIFIDFSAMEYFQ